MKTTPSGINFTNLVLETFRLNGALIAAGDQLVGDLGLTSARWQVLGILNHGPATVSEIARRRGLARQNVQRIADCLVEDGFAETTANPAHRRAKLYLLTPHGKEVMEVVDGRQKEWASEIADGLDSKQIAEAVSLMSTLANRLVQRLEQGEE
ncbi:MarR family transcriptional regulator [Geomonas silvestris]|uniref:MarR family transcriptional regulator n=1 Tax=Geomonas silvestris TaxID=2740184 RepID=A0A6V8MD52_9BACT|nr:MarR family transcriptional regulator [Geomonas silvestris]GFO57877.1 MarR family transcriptional regulator [Geomonas silvestris]